MSIDQSNFCSLLVLQRGQLLHHVLKWRSGRVSAGGLGRVSYRLASECVDCSLPIGSEFVAWCCCHWVLLGIITVLINTKALHAAFPTVEVESHDACVLKDHGSLPQAAPAVLKYTTWRRPKFT